MEELRDEELMLQLQQKGDDEAFRLLFERYRTRIASYIFRLLRDRDESESLAQETFLRLIEKASFYTYPRRFSTWLFTVARNLVSDYQKKKRAVISDQIELMADGQRHMQDDGNPEKLTIAEEELKSLKVGIEMLQPQHREVLILRSFYNMSYREIAEIVNCPESTARSRMDFALVELKKHYRVLDREKKGTFFEQ